MELKSRSTLANTNMYASFLSGELSPDSHISWGDGALLVSKVEGIPFVHMLVEAEKLVESLIAIENSASCGGILWLVRLPHVICGS